MILPVITPDTGPASILQHLFNGLDGVQQPLFIFPGRKTPLQEGTYLLPLCRFNLNAAIGNDFEFVFIQGDIQQQASTHGRVPYFQATKNLQRTGCSVPTMSRRIMLDRQHKFTGVSLFAAVYFLRQPFHHGFGKNATR